jgi:hypothetical protein
MLLEKRCRDAVRLSAEILSLEEVRIALQDLPDRDKGEEQIL